VNNHIICYIVNLKRQNRLKVGADITTVNLFSHVYKYCELLASWPAIAPSSPRVRRFCLLIGRSEAMMSTAVCYFRQKKPYRNY